MSEPMTPERLQSLLDNRFGGLLRYGAHEPDGHACALEAANVLDSAERDGVESWTDKPGKLPDLRRLNDAYGRGAEADEARTAALVPIMAALWDWREWTTARKVRFAQLLAVSTVREVLGLSLELRGKDSRQCRAVTTLSEARSAAAAAYAADAAAYAAYAAAYAADAAADAAAYAAVAAADAAAVAAAYASSRFQVLNVTCTVWLQAAKDSR